MYPPPYERLLDRLLIQRAINEFNWENTSSNINIHKKVNIFNEMILNIFSNYCTFKIIICNDKDHGEGK